VVVIESLMDVIYNVRPDEIYNLAAQSHVRVSFDMPEYTGDVTGLGTIRILEAIRRSGHPERFYQASSSEMFGGAKPPQNELTPFEPRSPYAAAKVYSYWVTRNYREGYKLFASNGILFNHESPGAARPLSHAKLPGHWPRSLPASRTNSSWETWKPSATGVTRQSLWRQCIYCCSRMSRMTT